MVDKQKWQELLKKKGLRITKQRLAILSLLEKSTRPLAAGKIFAALKKEFPDIRLSTVYRNLNEFEEKKMLRKFNLDFKKNKSYFELLTAREHHHHLICVSCEEIIPLGCPADYMSKLKEETGYDILEHKLKVYGICNKCQKAEDIDFNGAG